MDKIIPLRVIGYHYADKVQLVCIDTDIVVQAASFEDGKDKIKNALTSYFNSFSKDEIKSGAYIRKSPMRYQIIWKIGLTLSFIDYLKNNTTSFIANYDTKSGRLRLA